MSPTPDRRLLADCPPPVLVADPETASEEELQVERVSVAEAYACEKRMRKGIVEWILRVLFR